MIGGYTALVEKLFISYLRDILRPHNLNKFSVGIYKHKCNNGRVYYHYRSRAAKIEAQKFFNPKNPDFQFWCELMSWDTTEILKIVKDCVDNDKDRLYGKHALQVYFKQAGQEETDDTDDA